MEKTVGWEFLIPPRFKLLYSEAKGTSITPSRSELLNQWARSGSSQTLRIRSFLADGVPVSLMVKTRVNSNALSLIRIKVVRGEGKRGNYRSALKQVILSLYGCGYVSAQCSVWRGQVQGVQYLLPASLTPD